MILSTDGVNSAKAYTTDYKQPSLYNPIFATMYEQGLINPVFSMVINRNASNGTAAGYLTLGGLPPNDVKRDFSTTPILITNIKGYPKDYDFYTVNIDGVAVGNRSLPEAGGNIQYLVRMCRSWTRARLTITGRLRHHAQLLPKLHRGCYQRRIYSSSGVQ